MADALNLYDFHELSENELMMIDGGWRWRSFAGSVAAGAVGGAMAGAVVGGGGALPGAGVGALVGAASYCVTQIIG